MKKIGIAFILLLISLTALYAQIDNSRNKRLEEISYRKVKAHTDVSLTISNAHPRNVLRTLEVNEAHRGENHTLGYTALPNLVPWPAFGGLYIVPSRTTGNNIVSSTLPGNDSCYVDDWTTKNNSSEWVTDTVYVCLFVDGEISVCGVISPPLEPGDIIGATDWRVFVKGGRHTLSTYTDITDRINTISNAFFFKGLISLFMTNITNTTIKKIANPVLTFKGIFV